MLTRHRAWTLVELLVASSVALVATVAAVALIATAAQTQSGATIRATELAALHRASDQIVADARHAVAADASDGRLELTTQDHTIVWEATEEGLARHADGGQRPNHHVIDLNADVHHEGAAEAVSVTLTGAETGVHVRGYATLRTHLRGGHDG